MENYEQMKERHRKEIRNLRDKCKHKNKSVWYDSPDIDSPVKGYRRYCHDCGEQIGQAFGKRPSLEDG